MKTEKMTRSKTLCTPVFVKIVFLHFLGHFIFLGGLRACGFGGLRALRASGPPKKMKIAGLNGPNPSIHGGFGHQSS